MESKKLQIYQDRLLAASLIEEVLLNKISIQSALSKFPKGSEYINIKCAFDALMYKEADEDLRKNIEGYANLQDGLLRAMVNALKKNQQFSKNIIGRYLKYNKDNYIPPKKADFKTFLREIKRMINF